MILEGGGLQLLTIGALKENSRADGGWYFGNGYLHLEREAVPPSTRGA